MIKLIDNDTLKRCKAEMLYNPFMAKIISISETERSICDVLLYSQMDESGNVTAYILNASSNVTVFVDNADVEEISDFLETCGYCSVLSNVKLPLNSTEKSGAVMKVASFEGRCDNAEKLSDVDMKEVYRLLKDNFDNIPDYQSWYVDTSHRIRHGTSFIMGVKYNGEIVSCAVSSFITQSSAVINGVCCNKRYRNRGFAGECVGKAAKTLSDAGVKNIYVLCRRELEGFYIKNGLEKHGEWYEYIRQI